MIDDNPRSGTVTQALITLDGLKSPFWLIGTLWMDTSR
jgi:hypothetical protein